MSTFQTQEELPGRSRLAADTHVWQAGTCHTDVPNTLVTISGAGLQARGSPGASRGLAAATQHWDNVGTCPHGQSRVCHLLCSSSLPGPVVPSLPWLSAPGTSPGIQGSCSKYKEQLSSAETRDVSVTARAALKATGTRGEVGRAAAASGTQCQGPAWHSTLTSPLCRGKSQLIPDVFFPRKHAVL